MLQRYGMKPLHDNILIERVEQQAKSASGILITEKDEFIRVVAVADSVTAVKPGDLIEVANNSIIHAGDVMFVREKDVIATRGNS